MRFGLYVMGASVNAGVTFLVANGVQLSVYLLAGLAMFNTAISLMAGVNVTPDQE